MESIGHAQSPQRETPDAALIDRVLAGDNGAFRAIVVRYEPVVARTVRGMLGRGPDADDVGQEVFIRLHRGLAGFRGDASLKTYLTRIAINLSLNALEQRRAWRGRFIAAGEVEHLLASSGDARIESNENVELVRAAVGRLDAKHRAVVVLRMFNGCSTNETAEILSVPHGTVLSRLSRAMKMLEGYLKPYMDEL